MPKPPVKSVTVRFRALPKELAGWKRMARADAMHLSMWIRDRLNMAFDEPSPFAAGPSRPSAKRSRGAAP